MKLVVAVDKNWGIGYKGELLARVRADLRYFQSLTKGNTVVLGSKTLATFPGGRVLKDRINIVLSRRPDFQPENAIVLDSVDAVLNYANEHPDEEIFIIGGATVYDQFLPYCDTAYVTRFEHQFESDAFFKNLDESDEWKLVYEGEAQVTNPETDSIADMEFKFCTYERK